MNRHHGMGRGGEKARSDYQDAGERAVAEVRRLVGGNRRALLLVDELEMDPYIQGLLEHANTVLIGRLGYNDHGPTHSRLSTMYALQTLARLRDAGVELNLQKEGVCGYPDIQAAVLAGTYIHDIGNAVHRSFHWIHSTVLAAPFLDRALPSIFPEKKFAARMRASILEFIFAHDESVEGFSVEAGCVKIGDGCDMTAGRARQPFRKGKVDIHSISALSIQSVRVMRGREKPVRIEVDMTGSAGIFQIQNVLGAKLKTSGIKGYVEVAGTVLKGERERVLDRIDL